MKNSYKVGFALLILIGLLASPMLASAKTTLADDLAILVQISPSTFSLSSIGGNVSVHTDIAYGLVNVATVNLNGLTPYLVRKDRSGSLIAKFDMASVLTVVSAPSTTLVFSGYLLDGTYFSGSQVVTVTDVTTESAITTSSLAVSPNSSSSTMSNAYSYYNYYNNYYNSYYYNNYSNQYATPNTPQTPRVNDYSNSYSSNYANSYYNYYYNMLNP